ncbi:MAG TPA: hypothetical protein VGG48_00685 [Rhizomicrobium sp.]|jgi:hypothetical protein
MFSFLLSLGWYWLLLPAAVAVLGLFVFVRGFRHMFTGEPGRGVPRLIVGAPLAIIGLAFALLGVNIQSFARLTYEAPVADVTVKAVNPAQNLYQVTVNRLDGPQQTLVCNLQGDEWSLSARVQKWKPWANTVGLDATYTLDQMDNKYLDAVRANGKPITACDLKGPPPAVNQYVPKSWVFWLTDHSYTEDRKFGSAAYMPLANGATYRVIMTQSGLNAEPTNHAAKAANSARP